MDKEIYSEFNELRRKLAAAIRRELEIDCYCRSYEGTWELLASYPDYFQDETATAGPDFYRIALHCYVIGPSRHYNWDGKSWGEALAKCKADVESWIDEAAGHIGG